MSPGEHFNNEPDTMELPIVNPVPGSGPSDSATTRGATPPGDAGDRVAPPLSRVKQPAGRGRDALAALRVLVVMAILGLPLGVVWGLTVPRVEMVRVDGGWAFTQENPEQYFAADGVFALLGIGLGIAAALFVWLRLRDRRGPLVLTGLVFGSIACQVVAWRFGRIGRDAYQASLDAVPAGWHVWRAPELLMVDFTPVQAWQALLAGDVSGMWSHLALGVLATMAFAAAFTYTVCAGWSRFASLRKPDEPDVTHPTADSRGADHDAPPSMQNLTPQTGQGRLPSLGCYRPGRDGARAGHRMTGRGPRESTVSLTAIPPAITIIYEGIC